MNGRDVARVREQGSEDSRRKGSREEGENRCAMRSN